MKRSEMLAILEKNRKKYIDCCKKVDYNKLLKVVEEAGMLPPERINEKFRYDSTLDYKVHKWEDGDEV